MKQDPTTWHMMCRHYAIKKGPLTPFLTETNFVLLFSEALLAMPMVPTWWKCLVCVCLFAGMDGWITS